MKRGDRVTVTFEGIVVADPDGPYGVRSLPESDRPVRIRVDNHKSWIAVVPRSDVTVKTPSQPL